MDEEENVTTKSEFRLGQPLGELSIDELRALVAELKSEIARLEAAATEKSEHLSAADALFKK